MQKQGSHRSFFTPNPPASWSAQGTASQRDIPGGLQNVKSRSPTAPTNSGAIPRRRPHVSDDSNALKPLKKIKGDTTARTKTFEHALCYVQDFSNISRAPHRRLTAPWFHAPFASGLRYRLQSRTGRKFFRCPWFPDSNGEIYGC